MRLGFSGAFLFYRGAPARGGGRRLPACRLGKKEKELDAYEFAYLKLDNKSTDQITDLKVFERTIAIVVLLESEVNNGGLSQYYFNAAGDLANEAPSALRAIGAIKMADIIQRANEVFEGRVPVDQRDRQVALVEIGDKGDELFDDLDDEFLAYPEDVSKLLNAYYLTGKRLN